MRKLILLLLSTTAHAGNKSSLSPYSGDLNTAPINENISKEVPGDKVIPPLPRATNARISEEVVPPKPAEPPTTLPATTISETRVAEEDVEDFMDPPEPAQNAPAWFQDEPFIPQPEVVRFIRPGGDSVTIFAQNLAKKEEETITLPSGAHAFGRVKFGEEVTASGNADIMVELDYAFLGPNQSVVEMNGCVVWLKASSNFHTQRVNGQMQDMTCTMKDGRVFTVPLSGPLVAVASGYAGVDSSLIMRGPAKAAALKFLSEITRAYGDATSVVETTTQMMSSGDNHTDKTTNVTGAKAQYIQGRVIEANGKFLEYIASFFESMQPTLALPSGTKVHVVNRHNIKIPKQFFNMKGVQQ